MAGKFGSSFIRDTWATLRGKPSTFPPAAHTHTKNQITDFPTTWPWASLTGVPATFVPSAHVHAISDVTGLAAALAAIPGLATAAGLAGTANGTVGVSTKAAREDHTHPSMNQLLGTVNIAETGLVLLALSVRRVVISVPGAVVGGNYGIFPVNAVPAGFGIVDAVCTTAGQITFGMLVPVITGNYSIPVRVVRLLTP